MAPFIDFFALIAIIAVGQALLLMFYVFTKKRQLLSYRILALLLGLFAFSLTHNALVHTRYILKLPHFFGLGDLHIYLLGPLLFFYVNALTRKNYRLTWWASLHFIPFVIQQANKFSFYFDAAAYTTSRLQAYFSRAFFEPHFVLSHFLYNIVVYKLHLIVYLGLALQLLHSHARKIKQTYSFTEKINLAWMRYLLYGYMIVWLGSHLLSYISFYLFDAYFMDWVFSTLLTSGHILVIAYLQLNQKEVLVEMAPAPKYKNSALTQNQSENYATKLKQEMKHNEAYTDPLLSLQALAARLDMQPRYLSQVINE